MKKVAVVATLASVSALIFGSLAGAHSTNSNSIIYGVEHGHLIPSTNSMPMESLLTLPEINDQERTWVEGVVEGADYIIDPNDYCSDGPCYIVAPGSRCSVYQLGAVAMCRVGCRYRYCVCIEDFQQPGTYIWVPYGGG